MDAVTSYVAEFYRTNIRLIVAIVAIVVSYFGYQVYAKLTEPKYESVADDETRRSKLQAARLLQQERYQQYIEQNKEELEKNSKKQMKELNEFLTDVRKARLGEAPTSYSAQSTSDKDYFPLMGDPTSGSGGYKPTKRKPPGGCSGGGCG